MKDELLTSPRLGKTLPKAQKIIMFGALFVAIFIFLYSLIFMTPFSDIYQIDGPFLFTKIKNFKELNIGDLIKTLHDDDAFCYSIASETAVGLNIGYFTSLSRGQLQIFNKWLFSLSFFGLLATLLPFVYFSQKRKIYYKTNLVVNSAVSVFNLYIGIHMLVQLINNQQLVWAQNYQVINAYETYLNDNDATVIKNYFSAADSNPFFIIGYVLCFLIILFALATIAVTVIKFLYQKKQTKVDLDKVVIHE